MAKKEKSDKQHNGWGGKREGAGRKPTGAKLYTFRAPLSMVKVIDAQESKTEFFKTCIQTYMDSHGSFEQSMAKFGEVYPATKVADMEIPFFDIGIVAGFPVPLDNDEKAQSIELLRTLCPYPESSYLIRVKGNSMIDANIHDGDIVIVDKSNRNPTEKQVAVCEFNGEYTLKRFIKRGEDGWLVPANPDYPEIKVTADDDFSIWGVVSFVIHKPEIE